MLCKTNWALWGILIVKDNRNGGLGDTGLSTLIYQILQNSSSHLRSQMTGSLKKSRPDYNGYMTKIFNAKDKADCIQNIRLAWPVKTGYGIKLGIPSGYDRSGCIRFEALQNYLFDKHFGAKVSQAKPCKFGALFARFPGPPRNLCTSHPSIKHHRVIYWIMIQM